MLINDQTSDIPVPNPISHLPSISTGDMVTIMRIDKTKGSERIASYIVDAYDSVNAYLPTCIYCHSEWLAHKSKIARTDPSRIDRAYKRAIIHAAAAAMADDNIDYDTTSQGSIKGEAQLTKSDRLRRIVQHAIADMTGRRRNRIRLL